MDIVGQIRFDGHVLDVYDSVDTPLFMGVAVAALIDLENRSEEEISSLIKYISKYGFFQNTFIIGIDLASGKDEVGYFDE